ncbi:MAG: WG repeat-containing protein [Bacteroidetes bacterium]|nr:WG repeat-containing protein [Bacteroidota bacterium]
MKRYLIILALLFARATLAQESPLLRIKLHGKIGFIDTTGKVVIEPRFANVGKLHEGLAVAREPRGLYGYIDMSGRFVVRPTFEFALPFSEGFAIGYQHGRGHFIRRDGSDAFGFTFVRASSFEFGRSRVELEKDRWNLIDSGGKTLIDSNVEYIHEFHNGYAVVGRDDFRTQFTRKGVVDRNGRIRFYLDSVEELGPFKEGFFSCIFIKVARDAKGRVKSTVSAADVDPDGHMFPIPDDQIDRYIALHDVHVVDDPRAYAHPNGSVNLKGGDESASAQANGRDITYKEIADYKPITVDAQPINPILRRIGEESYGDSFPIDPGSGSSFSGIRIIVDASDTIRGAVPDAYRPSVTESFMGLRVTLENRSKDTILLSGPSKDELFILQARDSSGEWKDIEQIIEGDVSDAIRIAPNRMHLTACPVMHGYFNTTLRVRCDIYTISNGKEDASYPYRECHPTCIYSNEFGGSVNPAQFWRDRFEEFIAGDDD